MVIRRGTCAVVLLAGLAVPLATSAPADAAAPSLCAPPADTVGPVATRVRFGRASIDLDSGSLVQTVRVATSDTSGQGSPSGVARVNLSIQGGDTYAFPRLALVSGTPASGVWAGRFVVSKYARAGTASIGYLTVSDAAGNEQSYNGYGRTPGGPDALSLHPADNPSFTITGTPAKRPPSRKAGVLSGFSLSPTSVNTVKYARSVRVTARFTGAAPARVTAQLRSAKRVAGVRSLGVSGRLALTHGVWTGTVRVPRWAGRQVLRASLFVQARRGYGPGYYGYDYAHLVRLHSPAAVTVVSGTDRSKPALTSVTISPDPIDSTAGSQRVTITARVADTGSGVRSVRIGAGIQGGINGVAAGAYPYRSAGIGFNASDYLNVTLHRSANGSWTGTTTVRQCVPSGTYKLDAWLTDNAGNFRSYSTKQLARAHVTSTVAVTSKHGDVVAPYVFSAATYAADSEVFLNFSEGVRNVDTSTLTVYPLSPAKGRFVTTSTVSAIRCSNGKTTVDCSGSGGLVTSAVLTVPDLDAGTTYNVYANLREVPTQLTDGNGNPLDWNYAATEVIGA